MILSSLARQEMPSPEVFIQSPDRSLSPASITLADEVRGDLANSRDRILNTFGETSIPPVSNETESAIATYFADKKWTIPRSVVIDPEKDAVGLRNILQKAHFRSKDDEEFFTGANGQTISSGASPERDLVIYHDRRAGYRKQIQDTVEGWGYTITDNWLEHATELKTAEYIFHELAHLAGSLAVTGVVIEKKDNTYQLAERASAGFTAIEDDIPTAQLDKQSSYYCGPAIDEGWVAFNASQFILSQQGYESCDVSILDRYDISAEIAQSDRTEFYAVIGLHSGEAGMVIERIDEYYPGIISTMTDVADGMLILPEATNHLRTTIPPDIMQLLLTPNYEAWQQLRKQLNIVD